MTHKEIVELFESVGFSFHVRSESSETTIVVIEEYKYYPHYLKNTHYSILFVTYKKSNNIDYRLYVHKNEDFSFVSSPFQTSQFEKYALDDFHLMFKNELLRNHRLKTLTNILEDGKE